MYGIFTDIYDKNQPNVGRSTIHGCYEIPYTCLFPDADICFAKYVDRDRFLLTQMLNVWYIYLHLA